MIRVAIIDDDERMREVLEAEIDASAGLKFHGSFESFEAAELALHHARIFPDVLLLDLSLPGGADGIEAARQIKTHWPRIKVLVFSMHEDQEKILNAFAAGADGFLVKSAPRAELAEAIKRVHAGAAALSPRVSDVLVNHFRKRLYLLPLLSPMEKRILGEFDRGGTYKEIAEKMGMALNTLKTHAKRILVKSFADSMTQASYFRKQVV